MLLKMRRLGPCNPPRAMRSRMLEARPTPVPGKNRMPGLACQPTVCIVDACAARPADVGGCMGNASVIGARHGHEGTAYCRILRVMSLLDHAHEAIDEVPRRAAQGEVVLGQQRDRLEFLRTGSADAISAPSLLDQRPWTDRQHVRGSDDGADHLGRPRVMQPDRLGGRQDAAPQALDARGMVFYFADQHPVLAGQLLQLPRIRQGCPGRQDTVML